jgi:hypothetical protein
MDTVRNVAKNMAWLLKQLAIAAEHEAGQVAATAIK